MRRLKVPLEIRFWSKVIYGSDCWIWGAFKNRTGYGHVGGGGASKLSHRVAWTLEVGPIPSGMKVCHRCDNPSCVRPSHLFLGTQMDNVSDMISKGRAPVGERCGQSKLTKRQVLEIRAMSHTDVTQQEIADRFGISRSNVSVIVSGKTWR